MQRILFLSILTVLLICGVSAAPDLYKGFLPAASAVKLSEIVYTETINASGTVASPDGRSVTTDIPLVISRVCVRAGETVSEGQVLCEADREETAAYILRLAAVGGGYGELSYRELLAAIPDAVYSPYSGELESVSAREGEIIAANGTVAVFRGTEPMSVLSYVSEKEASGIFEGQPVIITGRGFGEREYHGSVEYISAAARRQYNGISEETVVDIRVSLDDADESVRSGYSAELEIPVSRPETVRVAPYEAVQQDENGEFVYVFRNGMSERREVKTGRELSDGVEILSGIFPDDRVLCPAQQLADGEYVVLKNH